MNCLNFVFVPAEIGSKPRLEQLHNGHVRRFYRSGRWRKKFLRRLWQHRESLLRLAAHLPWFWSARSAFAKE
jgi:hypothetical protein